MRIMLKCLSWAVFSGLLIGGTAYIESGSLQTAFVVGLISSMLKTPFYGVHEKAWDVLYPQPAKMTE